MTLSRGSLDGLRRFLSLPAPLLRASLLPFSTGALWLFVIVLASPGAAGAVAYPVHEFPVCTAIKSQLYPSISGGTVVWTDLRGGTPAQVYAYDLNTSQESLLGAPGTSADPVVSGSHVVWCDERALATTGYDIFGYDLLAKQEFPICTATEMQWVPAISGDIVVWEDWRKGENVDDDIWGYDLNTGKEFPVCTAAGDQWSPAVSGDIVVWWETRNGVSDIYGFRLSTKTEFPICTASNGQSLPAVSGNVVVWEDYRNNNYDIYGYDLGPGGGEFPICVRAGEQRSVDISGNLVVWADNRNGNWDIYGYDLATKTEFPICTNLRWQAAPEISGNTVVWQDDRNILDYDIYGATIGASLPLASTTIYDFAADATSGWHNTDQTVTITATGGVAPRTVHYSIDGGATWATRAGDSVAVTVTTDGPHRFRYYASDAGSSIEVAHDAGYVNVDKGAPTTAALGMTATGWVNHDVALTLQAADPISGVRAVQYKLGAGGWQPYTSPIPVSGDGETIVTYQATDFAGNVEAAKTATVRIDKSRPSTVAYSATVKKGRTVKLAYRVDDATPGCGEATATLKIYKGAALKKTLKPVACATNAKASCSWKATLARGSYTVKIFAADIAGNTQSRVGSAKLTIK